MHPRSYCARLGEVCSKCRSHLLVNNPRGGVRSLARNACKEPLVLVSKRKNNEKTSNSWNSFAASASFASACSGTAKPNTNTPPVKPTASPTATAPAATPAASPAATDKKTDVNNDAKPGLPTTSEPKAVEKKDGEKTVSKTADKPADVKKAN